MSAKWPTARALTGSGWVESRVIRPPSGADPGDGRHFVDLVGLVDKSRRLFVDKKSVDSCRLLSTFLSTKSTKVGRLFVDKKSAHCRLFVDVSTFCRQST